MIPPPPSSTLFPYTTLFRSDLEDSLTSFLRILLIAALAFCGLKRQALDRKSTRLNSSHRCISYAVFCLKKKKTPTRSTHRGRWPTRGGQPTPSTTRHHTRQP